MRRQLAILSITALLASPFHVLLSQTTHPGSLTVEGGVNVVTLTANGTDSYTGTTPRADVKSYQNGNFFVFKPDVDNTGPASLAVDGLTAKSIVRQDGSALEDSNMKAGKWYMVVYDALAGNLQLIGVSAATGGGGGGGGGSAPGGSANQLQYKIDNTTFGGVAGSAVNGSTLSLTGRLDASGPFSPPHGDTLPASCIIGEVFFKTNEIAGQNWYGCTATSSWTQLGGGATAASGDVCNPGRGVFIPSVGGAICAAGSATPPFAWGGLDFPNPATSGTTCIDVHAKTPQIPGSPPTSPTNLRLRMSFTRTDGTMSTSQKILFSLKTKWIAEGDNITTKAFNPESYTDLTPAGSTSVDINTKYGLTGNALDITGVQGPFPVYIQLCRQATGSGGRVDSTPATIRIIDFSVDWNYTPGSTAQYVDAFAAVSTGGSGGGSGQTGAQLYDDVQEWATYNGSNCALRAVNFPSSSAPALVAAPSGSNECGIQFGQSSSACAYLRASTPPQWDTVTAPTLFLTWIQAGSATNADVLMNAATWAIAEGSTYASPTFTQSDCTIMTSAGDGKKLTITCPSLSVTGMGAGRSIRIRVCRDGANTADTLSTPIIVTESKLRWTLTSACPAP